MSRITDSHSPGTGLVHSNSTSTISQDFPKSLGLRNCTTRVATDNRKFTDGSTPSPSITRSTIDFCKWEKRILSILKSSWPYSSGLGGPTGADPGLATPKISTSTPMTLSMVPPHLTSAFLCYYFHDPLYHQTSKRFSNAGLRPVTSDTSLPLQRLMGFMLRIQVVANRSGPAHRTPRCCRPLFLRSGRFTVRTTLLLQQAHRDPDGDRGPVDSFANL